MKSKVCSLLSRLSLVAMVMLVAATLGMAQSDSTSINGVVKDPSGALIPNAKVTTKNQGTGQIREATTNGSGVFVIPTVPAGVYTISIEANGFKKLEERDRKVDSNIPASVDVTLQVGQSTDTIQVEASSVQLQTDSGALGKLIEGKQLSELQLNGRNPIFLALLKPGVRGGNLSGFSFDLNSGGMNINGGRSQDNLITFDGAVGIRTRSNGTSIGTADLDTTSEVQVLTAAYSAEYGRAGGGQIRVVTKSGTSHFHGGAYEYLRNSALDANSWSRNRNPATNFVAPQRYNQFGYNIAGPVYIPKHWNTDRSKVFFLFAQEYVRRRQEATQTNRVPSELMKAGNFSELLTAPNIWYGTVQTIKDPQNGNAPFPGNIIPTNRLSANGLALLRVFPAANLATPISTNNWFAVASAPTNQRKDTYSLDVLPTAKDNVKFRMSLYHYLDLNPFQTNYDISARTFDRPNQTATLNWTRVINPTTVNETLIAASRDQVLIRMQDTPAFDRTKYGINYPYVFPVGKDRFNKLPTVDIPNFNGYSGSPYPSNSAGPIYTISNNTTKIINNHTIKFGVLFERAGQNDYDQINVAGVPGGTDNQNGRFVFSGSRPGGSGVPIGDTALGLFDSYAEIGTRSYTPYRGHMMEWFAQDSWKITSKLKLEIGLRHSIVQPYYSLWRNMSVFDPARYDVSKAIKVDGRGNPIPGTGLALNGLIIPGDGFPDSAKGRVPIATTGEYNYLFVGEKKYFSDIDYKNFQPRFGLAYSLNPKTVFRIGGGKFSTRLGVSDSTFLGGNPPLQPIASISYGSVDVPGGGSSASFPLSATTQAKTFKMPQSYNANFTVERELGFNTVVEVSYVFRRGVYGQREKNINQAPIGTLQAVSAINAAQGANTANLNQYRPYLGYGALRETFNDANSTYNGLQFSVNRRFSKGLSYGLAYTLSKSLDSGSGQRDIIPDTFNGQNLWGPSTYDTRHLAVINFIYEIPFLKNASNKLLRSAVGGWQVTGVTQFQTGTPFSVGVANGADIAGVGTGSGGQFAVVNGQYLLDRGDKAFTANPNDPNDKNFWFRAFNADGSRTFVNPAQGTFNRDRVRSIIYNPGFQNWNLGLFKTFRVTESQAVVFRAEAFNWLNHPNWGGADGNITSSTFGKVTGKNDQRNLQLSLRYRF